MKDGDVVSDNSCGTDDYTRAMVQQQALTDHCAGMYVYAQALRHTGLQAHSFKVFQLSLCVW